MRAPLLPPFAALAAGVLIGRYVPFTIIDELLGAGACLLLGILSLRRSQRRLAGTCCCLGLFFAGVWLETAQKPGAPPEIDAGAREVIVLAGCVVEPAAVSGMRERLVLELEPGARAQVTLYAKPD